MVTRRFYEESSEKHEEDVGMLNISEIIALRPERNKVEPDRPYHFLHEQEIAADGKLMEVNTIFLTNSECSFKCVMCDLWKNTLEKPVKKGDIPRQITYALKRLPSASAVKLYNNGNFFDQRAIPPDDYPIIVKLLSYYKRIIIENHPKLCKEACIEFQGSLNGQLEIAMGLETIHPDVLPKLNKEITKENFRDAAEFLSKNNVESRAFILLNPPYLTDPRENIQWTIKSVEYAFECGVSACSIIPTRAGNGVMEELWRKGYYMPPTLGALEEVLDQSLRLGRGRVFVDLWDLEQFSNCASCYKKRKARLNLMNLEQKIYPRINCEQCDND